jgi:hypothetical protein
VTGTQDNEEQRHSAFSRFLMSLPDRVALAADLGVPVTCPDPGTEHGRKLLATLGVEIEKPRP